MESLHRSASCGYLLSSLGSSSVWIYLGCRRQELPIQGHDGVFAPLCELWLFAFQPWLVVCLDLFGLSSPRAANSRSRWSLCTALRAVAICFPALARRLSGSIWAVVAKSCQFKVTMESLHRSASCGYLLSSLGSS